MTDISNRIEAWREMPPEPEWDGKHWWYKTTRCHQTEAFREYNDDRAKALQERIVELVRVLESTLAWIDTLETINEMALPTIDKARAILAKLKKERLA